MNLIENLRRKYTKNFIKYLIVGITWTLLNIFCMWLFIDVFLFPAIIGAALVVVALFIAKFYAYRIIGLIHRNFLKYSSTSIGFSIANIILIWLFVDIFHIPPVISSMIIVYGLFILRFFAFDKVGLMKHEREF